jgi:hypothetical protein
VDPDAVLHTLDGPRRVIDLLADAPDRDGVSLRSDVVLEQG